MGKGIKIIVSVAIGVALLALAGCGGDSDEPALKKSEFVRQGNTICGEWQRAREEVLQDVKATFEGGPPTAAEKEQALAEILEPYEEATAKIGDLNPPEADQAKVDAMVEQMEVAAEKAKEDPDATFTGSNVFVKANKATVAYGLDECTV